MQQYKAAKSFDRSLSEKAYPRKQIQEKTNP